MLPKNIAELSKLLTNNRGDRSLSYLARPNYLSAYLHYFLPWNLYRLCLLLPNLNLALSPGDRITDFGCGPLTFVSALWISCPDLRKIPLEINCIDRSGQALEAGKRFFTALCGETANTWKINLVKEDIDLRKGGSSRHRSAALVCVINMFNEIYEHLYHNNTEGLRRMAENAARLMSNSASASGVILTVEPGVPQAGRFISFLREAFLKLNRMPASPCTHIASCPLAGRKGKKWCHFAFETAGAPKELRRLSAAAKLPKERLVLSYLVAGKITPEILHTEAWHSFGMHKHREDNMGENVRVISDAFPLPNNCFGRYGCSSQGLILLTGKRNRIEELASHSLVTPVFAANEQRDQKSGALIAGIE
jgi:ribosomal protein RSM22 (predicted rRNA methylase)